MSDSNTTLIQPVAIDRWPRGIACDGGFRILGTPIGFGRAKGASLKFVAHVDDYIPPRGGRIMCTPLVAAAIGSQRRGLDALILGYDRKIRLGRMDIRLLPAGLGPGSAALEVSFKDRKIVYTGGVRLPRPLSSPAADVPECDLLLIDAAPAEPRPPSPRRVAVQLVDWVEGALSAGQVPVLTAGSLNAALDVVWALRGSDYHLRAHRSLFEILRRIGGLGYSLPHLTRLEEQWPSQCIVLHLARLWPGSRLITSDSAQVAYVGPGRLGPTWAEVAFRLGENEDRPGVVSFAKNTRAAQVALGPNCDAATSALLQKAGVSVYRVSAPEQIPLPF